MQTTNYLPSKLRTDLTGLRIALNRHRRLVFDFETDGLDPRRAIPAGIGFYFPKTDEAWYANLGHCQVDPLIPKHDRQKLINALIDFFGDPSRHAIAHNASYDLRMLMQLGVPIRCRVSCTMILAHRCDENLVQREKTNTTHKLLKVGYGLKSLTAVLFGVQPPTLNGTIGGTNTIFAAPAAVARYCIADVANTWRIYKHYQKLVEQDEGLRRLIEEIDEPNHIVLAKMIWEGISVDCDEARCQIIAYDEAIHVCRKIIWKEIGAQLPVDTPKQVQKILSRIGVTDAVYHEVPEEVREYCEISARNDDLEQYFYKTTVASQRLILAAVLAMRKMKQRQSSFLRPLGEKVQCDGRLRPAFFSSLLVTTRFSSTPNLQNLPRQSR